MTTSIAIELDNGKITDTAWTPAIETALVRSLNKTAARSRTAAARAIREQIAFPASYLSPSAKRLFVSKRASTSNPFEAEISGRDRPTSLARFTKQKPGNGRGRPGGRIGVTVAPGRKHFIKRAFLITLNNGNIGLATRTNGGAPPGAYKPKEIFPNLWLLYGPSVDQVLASATNGAGVYEELLPDALDFLNDEFIRQLDLLNV